MSIDLEWCGAFGRECSVKIDLCQRLIGWTVTRFLTCPEIWRTAMTNIAHERGHSRKDGEGPKSTFVINQAGQASRSGPKRSREDQPSEEEASSVRIGKRKCNSKDHMQSRLFACPFFKHSRARYKLCRSCPGPGWQTVHRLK